MLPLHANGAVAGVLDIDSPRPGRFTEGDAAGVALLAPVLEGLLA